MYVYLSWLAAHSLDGYWKCEFVLCLPAQGLVGLNFMQEKREADFRYALVRVRENAESIAFYKGEDSEIQLLLERFKQSFLNYSVSGFP